MFGEKTKLYEQRKVAARILQALTLSSLADELKFYQRVVQNDLHLSDEEMTALFSFSKFAELMTPDEPCTRKYKGVSVETWNEYSICDHTTAPVEEQVKIPIPVDRPCITFPVIAEEKIPIPVDRPCITFAESVAENAALIPENKQTSDSNQESSSDDEKNTEKEEEKDTPKPPVKEDKEEAENVEESSSSDEEEEKSPMEILREKLKNKGLNNLVLNDTKIPGSIIVTGKISLKKHQNEQIRSLGGVWTASETGYLFNVKKLVK